MDFTELVLAGVTKELSASADARTYADALAYQVRTAEDVTALEEYDGAVPVIATNWRSEAEDPQDQERTLEVLGAAVETDPVEAVELEYDVLTGEKRPPELRNADSVDLIAAYRNHDETPDSETLRSRVDEAAAHGDIVYIETMAETPDDSLTLLSAINDATSDGITIGGACLGAVGKHTRVIAPTYGSKLAYAPLQTDATSSMAGEIPLKELAELISETEDPNVRVSLHDRITNPMVTDE